MTYRLNSDLGSFETWDGEEFHVWKGKLEVDTYTFRFTANYPTGELKARQADFDRETGKITESIEHDVLGEKSVSIFEGTCASVSAPKPASRKF